MIRRNGQVCFAVFLRIRAERGMYGYRGAAEDKRKNGE